VEHVDTDWLRFGSGNLDCECTQGDGKATCNAFNTTTVISHWTSLDSNKARFLLLGFSGKAVSEFTDIISWGHIPISFTLAMILAKLPSLNMSQESKELFERVVKFRANEYIDEYAKDNAITGISVLFVEIIPDKATRHLRSQPTVNTLTLQRNRSMQESAAVRVMVGGQYLPPNIDFGAIITGFMNDETSRIISDLRQSNDPFFAEVNINNVVGDSADTANGSEDSIATAAIDDDANGFEDSIATAAIDDDANGSKDSTTTDNLVDAGDSGTTDGLDSSTTTNEIGGENGNTASDEVRGETDDKEGEAPGQNLDDKPANPNEITDSPHGKNHGDDTPDKPNTPDGPSGEVVNDTKKRKWIIPMIIVIILALIGIIFTCFICVRKKRKIVERKEDIDASKLPNEYDDFYGNAVDIFHGPSHGISLYTPGDSTSVITDPTYKGGEFSVSQPRGKDNLSTLVEENSSFVSETTDGFSSVREDAPLVSNGSIHRRILDQTQRGDGYDEEWKDREVGNNTRNPTSSQYSLNDDTLYSMERTIESNDLTAQEESPSFHSETVDEYPTMSEVTPLASDDLISKNDMIDGSHFVINENQYADDYAGEWNHLEGGSFTGKSITPYYLGDDDVSALPSFKGVEDLWNTGDGSSAITSTLNATRVVPRRKSIAIKNENSPVTKYGTDEVTNRNDVKDSSALMYSRDEMNGKENSEVNPIPSKPTNPINSIPYISQEYSPQEVANDIALQNVPGLSKFADDEGPYRDPDSSEIIGPSVREDLNSSVMRDEEDDTIRKESNLLPYTQRRQEELRNDDVLQGNVVASRSGIAISDTQHTTEEADFQPTNENRFDKAQLNLDLVQGNGQDSTRDASLRESSSNAIDNIIQNGASLSWFGAVYDGDEAQSEVPDYSAYGSSPDLLDIAEEYNAQQQNMNIQTSESSHDVPTQGLGTSMLSGGFDSTFAHHSMQSSGENDGRYAHLEKNDDRAHRSNSPI